jgi:hypothetical protein
MIGPVWLKLLKGCLGSIKLDALHLLFYIEYTQGHIIEITRSGRRTSVLCDTFGLGYLLEWTKTMDRKDKARIKNIKKA